MRTLTPDEAAELAARHDFPWWQIFELAPGIRTPGVNDMDALLARAGFPDDLDGASVLDIGTANGAAAFIAERRGAGRVVAVDICDDTWNGFRYLRDALGSRSEFVRSSIYQLPDHPAVRGERFDIVLLLGVLYHLRHPLLGLDSVRRLTGGRVYLETAVSDGELPDIGGLPVARFFRTDELGGDPTNWFSPTMTCLMDFCRSAGFEPMVRHTWPDQRPLRAILELALVPGDPEWTQLSYERPLRVEVEGMST